MKKLNLLLLMIILCPLSIIRAQNDPKISLIGPSSVFVTKLKGAGANAKTVNASSLTIPLPDGSSLKASVDVIETIGSKEFFHGKINHHKTSLFNVISSNGSVEGSIIFKDKKRAYRIYSDDKKNVLIKEESINDLICTEYVKKKTPASIAAALPVGVSVSDLQSYPSATAVIMLDFDGHYVPSGSWGEAIDALPSGMSDEEIYSSWQLASDDFRPFNVNVTTSESVYQSAPANQRMRAIITPTNTAAPGWGGVAFIGSFTWGNDTPCWVFNLGAKNAGETISHEIGHTLGLWHDGTNDGTNHSEYFWGHNNWGPIMGAAFGPEVVQWSKGEYQHANNQEDDLTIITTQNNFGYRADASGIGSPVQILTNSSGVIVPTFNNGVIETAADVDVHTFTKNVAGNVIIGVNQGLGYGISNLDVLLTLRDANQNVIATSNPVDSLSASLNVFLSAGTYYIHIEGVGKGDPLFNYSDYGSLGYYEISGNLPAPSGVNLALNKPAFSSSVENGGTPAVHAVDGNSTTTRWASVFSDPQWITVDLQQTYNIDRVKITWEAAYGRNYLIQTSNTNNGSDWVTIKTVTGNTVLVNDWTGLSGSARYVRIYGTARGTGYGYSIYELEVYEGGLPNQPPLVNFTSPTNNSVFPPNSNITFAVNTSDVDGTVTKVEFFNGATKLGEDLAAPFSFVWANVAVGNYTIQARATDDDGATATTSVNFRVEVPNPPTVSITSPANGSTFRVDESFLLAASASDADGNITKVDFYLNGEFFNTDFTAPYEFTVSVSVAMTETVTAVAYDNSGLSTASAPVTFTIVGNVPPVATITTPSNGNSFVAPANILITADVADSDGRVTKVEFYNGSSKIGETIKPVGSSSLVSFNWQNVAPGNYAIMASAIDDKSAAGYSEVINISVQTGATNLALNKPATSSANENAGTSATFAVDGSTTTRWSSPFSDPQWLTVDLGANYSIDRVLIIWEAAYGKDYKVQLSSTNNGTDWVDIKTVSGNTALTNDWTGLSGSGRYLRVFGTARGTTYGYSIFELQVYGAPTTNTPPEVAITSPATNTSIPYGQTVILTATATDADGAITKVEFYNGASLINTATSAPYTIYWPWVGVGTYGITAKAYDNAGAVATSSPVTIHVVSSTNLALNKPATASSIENAGTAASYAVDGNSTTTRWSSAFADPQWLTVDLGASYNITRVKITWEAAYGKNYKLQVSNTNNGSDWVDIMGVFNNATLVNDWTSLGGSGRYIRVYGTARGTAWGYSIYELEVYGTPASPMASALADERVHAFPNPAQDEVTIEFLEEADINAAAELVLIDPFLQEVGLFKKAEGVSEVLLNTSALKTGAYLLKINSGSGYSTKRILIGR